MDGGPNIVIIVLEAAIQARLRAFPRSGLGPPFTAGRGRASDDV
jgi:hypothetical protein